MTYRDSLSFTYDGISSDEYGIFNVNTESGMLEESFLPTRSLQTVKVKGRPEEYFQDFDFEPKKIPVTIAFKNTFDTKLQKRLSDWLFQDYYKQLIFSSHPERVFYAMIEGDSSLFHNAVSQGYIKLTFVCNSPYSFSPVYFDTSSHLTTSSTFTFNNEGSVICKPVIKITKINNGDIRIVNSSDGGREFAITGLLNNEEVTINNEVEDIVTNIPNTYRFSNHNGNYLELVKGNNYLNIYGTCKIEWIYEYKYFV